MVISLFILFLVSSPADAQEGNSATLRLADDTFSTSLIKAFKKSRLLMGLNLNELQRKGKIRTLELKGNGGKLRIFHLSALEETKKKQANADEQRVLMPPISDSDGNKRDQPGAPVSESQSPGLPAVPVTKVTQQTLPVPTDKPGEVPLVQSPDSGKAPIPNVDSEFGVDEERRKGSFHFTYSLKNLPLSSFKAKGDKGTYANLVIEDAVLLFSSEKRNVKLSKLAITSKMERYLKKFIKTKRRIIEMPEGGLIFGRVSTKNNPYLKNLDTALNFKHDELLIQGKISGRLLRRLIGLNPANKGRAGVGPDDLDMSMAMEGFRPPKIGRYVDASDVLFNVKGTAEGRLVISASAAARFGIGARKVKVPATIAFNSKPEPGKYAFEMTAKAGKKALRNVKIGGNPLTELDFQFALTETFEPKLRAAGHAEKKGRRIPIAGELDAEDGRELFKLDGATLEAISGLDIPGFDEIKLPEIPNLNTGRAVSLDTVIRDQPAKIVIGPIINNQATYVALSMEGGGIENLIPLASLGNLGKTESGRSVFLYIPKGRAPPKLSELPSDFTKLFSAMFSDRDLKQSKRGLNLFQSTTFAANHPFSRGLSLLRKGRSEPSTVKITGRIDPLIFDEPEDSIKQTWSGGDARARLRNIISTLDLKGHVSGLDGIGLGTLFRLADSAEFGFKGTRSGKLNVGLTFGGAIKLRGAKTVRLFEFDSRLGETGRFSWEGDEVDTNGEDIKGGQNIKLSGVIRNNRPQDMELALKGSFQFGDLFRTKISGVSDLIVRDISLSKSAIVGTLAGGNGKTKIYIASKEGVNLAVAVLDGVKPSAYLPGLSKTPFADLAMPVSIFMIADEGVNRGSIESLPRALADSLLATLDKEKIEPEPGISFLSRINFKGSDPLAKLAVRLGVPKSEIVILHGKVPASVLTLITKRGGGAAKVGGGDLSGLALTAQFPPISVPGLDQIFKLDGPSMYHIAGTDTGQLDINLTTSGRFTVPIVNREDTVAVKVTLNGNGSARQVLIKAITGAPGSDPSKRVKLTAQSPFNAKNTKAAMDFTITFENGMTLADVLGRDIPGIGSMQLSDAKLSLNHIKGTLVLGDSKFTVNIATVGKGGGGRKVLTMEAAELPGLSVIPGLSKTNLKNIKLQDLVLAYLPGNGDSGTALPIDQLPDVLQHLKGRLSLSAGGKQSGLLPGLNLVSQIDTSNLGALTDFLKTLNAGGGGGGKFNLSAYMPGDGLAFLRERLSLINLKKSKNKKSTLKPKIKKLAQKVINGIIKKTSITVPIPPIKFPGVGQYVSTRSSRINVAGFEHPDSKVIGLKTVISSAMDFSVPGTPTTGSFDSTVMQTTDVSKNVTAKMSGSGTLNNANAKIDVIADLGRKGANPNLEISIAGETLTLGTLTGLNIPGVSELALNKVVIKPGELSGEIELKGAVTKVSAFDFNKTRRPTIALVSENINPGAIIPSVEGTLLDAATVDSASLLFVPTGRMESAGEIKLPNMVGDVFQAGTVKDGLNVNLKMTPKPTGQLADLLRGIGVGAEDPLTVTGQMPTNLFEAEPADVISKINLAAILPKLSFSKVGSIAVDFPKPARLIVNGSEAGFTSHIETALKITLPSINRSFSGDGKFTTKPADGGGRLLQFAGKTEDSGGKPAIIEASLKLPGSPKDFTVKFAGEQTLTSLLGIDIPVIGDLSVRELEKGEDFLVGKISLKGAQTTVGAFQLNGRWAIAVSAESIKPAELIPGLDNLPGKNLVLPSAMFVFIPALPSDEGTGASFPFDVTALPKQVSTALSDVLKPFGGISLLQPGLNLKSLLDVSKIPKLARVLKFTGNKSSKPFSLTGQLPIESLLALTKDGTKFATKGKAVLRQLIAKVDLSTELPAVNLPGVRDIVRFNNPILQIKGDGSDDKLALAMKIAGTMQVLLPSITPLTLAGSLSIEAVDNGVAVKVTGTGSPKGKDVKIEGTVVLNKADPQLQMAFTSAVTVADLIGAELPGLADLAITDARFGSEVFSGTIQYRGAKTTLAVFDFKTDKKPFIALISESADIANFVPGIAGSPLDNATLTRAALMYVPDGKTSYPQNKNFSATLTEAVKLVSRDYAVTPLKGLRAGFDVNLKESGPLAQALNFVGYKKTSMKLRGQLPLIMVKRPGSSGSFNTRNISAKAPNVNLPRSGGRRNGPSFASAALDELIRGVDLEAEVPVLNLPGIDKVIEFGNPTFRVKGSNELDATGNPTGKVKLRVGINGDIILKIPKHDLKFAGGFDVEKSRGGKAFKLALYSTTRLSWKKAFAVPFLDLNEIGLAGAIERKTDGQGRLSASLNSKVKLNKEEFDSTATIETSSSGLPEVRFNINSKIKVSSLPGLKDIKGLNEVAFSNLWVGTGGLGGRAEISKLGIGGAANLFFQDKKPVLLLKADQFTLKQLLPKVGLPKMFDDLAKINFPSSVFAFSAVDLRKVTLSSLPDGVQPMLDTLVGGPSDTVPIGDGISLLTALSKDDLSTNLGTLVEKHLKIFDSNGNGGISGPLLLSGSLEGVFSGRLKAKLAVKLPAVKLPEQPWAKIINFDSGGAEAIMDIDVPNTSFLFGFKGNMILDVPRIGESVSDKITVVGGVWIGFDPVTWAGAFKVSGATKGDWTRPFGINDHFTLSNSAISIGADSDLALEFGIEGGMKVTGLPSGNNIDGTAAFLININFAAGGIPIPKKLAFLYKVKGDTGILPAIEMNEAVFKGVLTGPMAKLILEDLREPKLRAAFLSMQSKLRKGSLIKVMQLDKLPLPFMKIQDPQIYFATPGAKIPDTDAFDTMGVRLGGKLKMDLLGKEFHLAGADLRLTLVDGLVAKADLGNIEIPKIGGLTNVKFDMVANPLVIPPQLHLKYSGALDVLGLKQSVDVEVSKDRVKLEFERDLARLITMHVKANTIGDNLLKVKDFKVSVVSKTEIDTIITKEILPLLGVPKIVSEVIKKQIPLFIHGVEFKGSLVNFLKGKGKGDGSGWELAIDHSFGGIRMPPAIARVYPIWSSTNPFELIPAPAVALAMTKSFVRYLATNQIKLSDVDLGLVKISNAKLQGKIDFKGKKPPSFLIGGKTNVLGASREVLVALSDKGYAFALNDKIAGGLYSADLKFASVGGTALAPDNIKYSGQVTNGFSRWLKNSLGAALKKNSKVVSGKLKSAQSDLTKAKRKVETLDSSIVSARKTARKSLKLVSQPVKDAQNALNIADNALNKAQKGLSVARDKLRTARKKATKPKKGPFGVKIAIPGKIVDKLLKAPKALVDRAGKAASGLRGRRNKASNDLAKLEAALERTRATMNVDGHPIVAPLIVARVAAVKSLSLARLTLAGADEVNKGLNKITSELINSVAGNDTLRINELIVKGNVNQLKTEFHLKADILGEKNVYSLLRINLTNPADTDLSYLTDTILKLVQNKPITRLAGNLPAPPKLPVELVSQAEIAVAIAENIKAARMLFPLFNGANFCAEETSGKTTPGGKVVLWSCVAGEKIQDSDLWVRNKLGQITSNNGYCLDVANPDVRKGISVITWTCNDRGKTMKRQLWKKLTDGRIQHIQSGFCLDATNEGNENSKLKLEVCSDKVTQLWQTKSDLPPGTNPSNYRVQQPVFDAKFYLNNYSDLKKRYGNNKTRAYEHWLRFGMEEGRQGSPDFSIRAYLERYSDLKSLFGTNYLAGFKHWNQFGRKEKRDPKPVDKNRKAKEALKLKPLVNHRNFCADETSGKLTRRGQVIMWNCNTSGESRKRQLWAHNSRGQITTTNGLCLDVANPSVRSGISIILWGCNDRGKAMERQRWKKLSDGRIQHIQSGLCLDATNDGNKRGKLKLEDCSDVVTQKWQF